MSSLNKAQILGNLTANPEIRETPTGVKVATFSVATSSKWKDKNGEAKEETEYHRVVIWGNLAEIVEKYLSKGKKVLVEGKIKTRSWEDDSGIKRYATEIVGDNLIMLSAKGNESNGSNGSNGSNDDTPESLKKKYDAPSKNQRVETEIHIDDIPF